MSTRRIDIGQQWQKITDGTETRFFEVYSGSVILNDSEQQPSANDLGHKIQGSMTIYPPTVAWVRVSSGQSAVAIIS